MRLRYKAISILLMFLLLCGCLFSCSESNDDYTSSQAIAEVEEVYTPSLIFEESQGTYVVTGIDSDASEIIIPSTYKGKIVEVGDDAFKDCKQIEIVDINCFIIGKNAFENCTNIKSITIGKDVCIIREYAFANTENLNKITYLAENIEDIPAGTFRNAGIAGEGIKLTIGKNVKKFPGWFFSQGNESLKSVIFEENSQCSYIGPYAFYCCENLTCIVIPQNVTYIGTHCFVGCEKLKTVSFENREDDWKIHKYRTTDEYMYIINSDTVKNETEIAKKLVSEYSTFDWRR